MARLPPLTASAVIKIIKKSGFDFDRQAKGSHEIWYNPNTKKRDIILNL